MIDITIQLTKVLKPKTTRKITKDTMHKISIPTEWVQFLKIKKGDKVELELLPHGFMVNITT
jgi:hypothetical protein